MHLTAQAHGALASELVPHPTALPGLTVDLVGPSDDVSPDLHIFDAAAFLALGPDAAAPPLPADGTAIVLGRAGECAQVARTWPGRAWELVELPAPAPLLAARLATAGRLARMARVCLAGELTAAIAHEVAQPLAALRTNARAALALLERDQADPEDLQEIFADILADEARVTGIVERLRNYVKAGRPNTEGAPVALPDLLAGVLRRYRARLEASEVTVHVSAPDDLPALSADSLQLEQVVRNLVDNALTAMSTHALPAHRELRASFSHDDNGLVFSLDDSGPGLPSGAHRIFEPFVSTRPRNLGLGLALCRRIVEAHGGTLQAGRAPAGGARFAMTFPRPALSRA